MFRLLASCISVVCLLASAEDACAVSFAVDATRPGRVLPNPSQTITVWHLPKDAYRNVVRNKEYNVLDFVEYVEVMGATGGNPQRDCFRNPADRSVLDDYDFSRVVEGCRGILSLGLKPYLKLGNVPEKLSAQTNGGDFHMNIRPPDDFAAYGRYMEACAKALLDAFGREELLTWRFSVLTEYENGGWFKDGSGDAEKTFQAYCRLYETTVTAFSKVVLPKLAFGAHSMTVVEGLWDERRFVKFVAERHLPLTFLTTSFYDECAGVFTRGFTLPRSIAHLRDAAVSAGLTNLQYAVDEGRLLNGAKGRDTAGLLLRIVGDTYQAAYDARVVKQLFDSRAEYFAGWGYLSGTSTWFEGLPSVSFYVAREAAKFKTMRRLDVVSAGAAKPGIEADAVAAVSADGRTVRLMAYAFTNSVQAVASTAMRFNVKLPAAWAGKTVRVTSWRIDDDANWYDEWRRDRAARGIGDERFGWSPDDPAPANILCSPADKKMFYDELEPRYRACARLSPVTRRLAVGVDGMLSDSAALSANAALFLEVCAD